MMNLLVNIWRYIWIIQSCHFVIFLSLNKWNILLLWLACSFPKCVPSQNLSILYHGFAIWSENVRSKIKRYIEYMYTDLNTFWVNFDCLETSFISIIYVLYIMVGKILVTNLKEKIHSWTFKSSTRSSKNFGLTRKEKWFTYCFLGVKSYMYFVMNSLLFTKRCWWLFEFS